jgi:cyanate lyase
MEIGKTTETLLKAKEEKKLSFAAIGKGIGRSEMFVSALFHSAIDFTMDVEREKDPKGDRIKVTMSGKYLPYKIW